MKMEQWQKPALEKLVEIKKDRTLTEAELLKGGAEYKIDESNQERLEATEQQTQEAQKEMFADFAEQNKKLREELSVKQEEIDDLKETVKRLEEEKSRMDEIRKIIKEGNTERKYRFSEEEYKKFIEENFSIDKKDKFNRGEFELRKGIDEVKEIDGDEFAEKYGEGAELLIDGDIRQVIDIRHSIDIVPSLHEIPQHIVERFEKSLKAARNLPADKEFVVMEGKTYIVDKK